jgi:tRNA-2-methylthio-N6-dimethylallyladenosine synthase
MRRSYRAEKFLAILDKVRASIPDAAISTDVIVGFPGETEGDFAETLRVVEASRFASAFTFQYSPRPGTPAADVPDQIPKEVVQERFERLLSLQDGISLEEGQALIGTDVEVLVTEAGGRKDGAAHRMSGRARDNRLVHFSIFQGAVPPRAGDLATVGVTYAAPHHLIADSALAGGTFSVRATRAGDLASGDGGGHGDHDDASHGDPRGGSGHSGARGPLGAPVQLGAPVPLGIPAIRPADSPS